MLMTQRHRSIDIARRREVAARHQLDVRTLDRAIDEGPDEIRGMASDRARRALADLGVDPPAHVTWSL